MAKGSKRLSDRIKEVRGAMDLSQDALASKAKISLRGLQDIEYEKTDDPKVSTIWGISNATGLSIDFLIKGNQPPRPGPIDLAKTADFLTKMSALPPDPQALVFAIVLGDDSLLDTLSKDSRRLLADLLKSLGIKP